MNNRIRLAIAAATLAGASAAHALSFETLAGQSFSNQFVLTPNADNKAAFSVSGPTAQFSALSFAVAGGPTVTGATVAGSWVAAFNDGRNSTYLLQGGTDYIVTISGVTLANVPGGHGLVSVSALNSAVVAVPEPESFALLLAGLGVVGALARRRNKRSPS